MNKSLSKEEYLPSNRKFGLFFAAVFVLLALHFGSAGFHTWSIVCAVVGAMFLGLSLFRPTVLKHLNRGWAKIGQIMGLCVSPVVAIVLFIVLITPVAIITRLFQRDELDLKAFQKNSSWTSPLTVTSKFRLRKMF